MHPLIIYHAHCPDGFGAAFSAWKRYGDNAQYLPADHGFYPTLDEMNVDGREVFIVDFSFPRKTLEQMAARAKSVVILDHHKSAEKALAGFPGAIFDMDRSGAVMAWEYFHPGEPVPQLLQWIQDRDIWRWELPDTAAALAYLDMQPRDFEVWNELATSFPNRYIEYGRQIDSKLNAMATSVANGAEPLTFCGCAGHKVNIGTGNAELRSVVGDKICQKNGTFAFLWRIEKGMLSVSLRAAKGTDASAMAERFGGGGHEGAAAFKVPLNTAQADMLLDHYILHDGETPAE